MLSSLIGAREGMKSWACACPTMGTSRGSTSVAVEITDGFAPSDNIPKSSLC